MKKILKCLVLLLLGVNFCCNVPENPKKEKASPVIVVQKAVKAPKDSSLIKAVVVDTIEKELKLNQKKNSSKTKTFLNEPFDFLKFKKEVRGANTTTSYNYSNFFRPNHKGFFFTYFVFNRCQPRGLQISVYKKGYQMGKFSDKDEIVIAVENECSLKALGDLDLVDKSLTYLEENIGKNYLKKGSEILFAEKGIFLLLSLSHKSTVRSFKYLKTNQKRIESFDAIANL